MRDNHWLSVDRQIHELDAGISILLMGAIAQKLLWVDDEVDSEDSTVALLRTDGFEVRCARTGAQGIDALASDHYTVMILDLRLPDMSGLDLLGRVRGHRLPPTLVLSGYADLDAAVAAVKLGALDVRHKPLFGSDLISIVGSCVRDDVIPTLVDGTTSINSFVQAFQVFAATTGACAPETPRSAAILATLEHIQTLLKQRHTPDISQAVRHYGGSGASFRRQLFAETRMSYRQWRRLLRVRIAVESLAKSAEQIRQIGFKIGYEHPAQFDRDFMSVVGISPKHFRERAAKSARAGSDH